MEHEQQAAWSRRLRRHCLRTKRRRARWDDVRPLDEKARADACRQPQVTLSGKGERGRLSPADRKRIHALDNLLQAAAAGDALTYNLLKTRHTGATNSVVFVFNSLSNECVVYGVIDTSMLCAVK
ncbi:hypothetical protein MRX96_005620 [Rhipicephalus microplus]